MYWQDDDADQAVAIPDDIIDVQFAIDAKRLPVDHGCALGAAVAAALPWDDGQVALGVHTIHVAGSQNGWQRPEHGQDQFLMLSRRTKLTIRVPRAHAEALKAALAGRVLDVAGCPLTVGAAKERALSRETTLFARYVVDPHDQDEARFLEWAAAELRAMDIRLRKALCGKALPLATPDGPLPTRSLLLANLDIEDAVRLQRLGLGPRRAIGCGLFIPHKGIDAVQSTPR
ncbi:type I-MYXAN CRISPR-associated protein Cas6/Cmx6 [Thiococcus pfennigii]|jgi:CRISPR-associated protein Cas6|uniref:type I-MYXAN CRISPR-associated protein Cas6/Cmx6 n=1 Tax=Thiococcus pfennigii TaxID=1057 RepID=UPI001904647C|nr:type I-MYXAN CRISPR-associated protein Cas6/Cmx6 [Thiococcus pfennigii]MBK1700370.1 type I-MYXAN CRISPR-associated protein Cas6/Cmx6 [Thiococcus pfennigii]MBK1732337.1 type I-MYXAN CRISPR-associated protein Cas6/Cmx6 [Thiococcus pfennigii]